MSKEEDVLQIINHVKNKKCEGSLYMMGERMAWMPSGKDSFTVSHKYADIKTQKISPDTKDKIQLQVVFTAAGANTFHFTNPAGRNAQIADRDTVKDYLLQLLPKFKPKINNELAEKNRLLQTDPDLYRLYKELVVSEMMTADEFWTSRVNKLKSSETKIEQDVGVSASFLADVRGQNDGCNGVKYTVTAEIMASIFRTYPSVQKKHLENVPHQMSEEEFWKQFFQSHYFHRDHMNIASKELFADCANQDEKTIENEIVKVEKYPLINIAAMSDCGFDQDYNNTQEASSTLTNKALIIKRFNQHSTLVLKTCDKKRRADDTGGQAEESINGGVGRHQAESTAVSRDDASESSKQAKIKEMIGLSDLTEQPTTCTGPALKLARIDPYMHGPASVIGTQYTTSEELMSANDRFTHDLLGWNPHSFQVMPSSSGTSVFLELSPGGALMQNYSEQQPYNLFALSENGAEAKILYSTLAELLRHFWACFPTTSKELEDKVIRMNESLVRFQKQRLEAFARKQYSSNVTWHMDQMLAVATKKFNAWQMRRHTKRT